MERCYVVRGRLEHHDTRRRVFLAEIYPGRKKKGRRNGRFEQLLHVLNGPNNSISLVAVSSRIATADN